MVFDDYRNAMYAEAIRKLVTPDSVVLDLGAGLGVHGLLAAAAGARRVYLVEPEPVVQIAGEVARGNGLADRIVVLENRIEDVKLPEPVDLIVSVFTGNLLYSEDLLPSLFYARDQYLKPGGRMLPDLAELKLVPVSAPGLHARHIARWSELNFGLDYSPARRFAANELLWLDRDELQTKQLGEEVVLSAVDLMAASQADCAGEAQSGIGVSGLCHGLLGWIRIRLGEQWLSSDPASPEVHWAPVLLPIDPPLPLHAGESLSISLKRPARGDWTWTVRAESGTRRHSTFLARASGLQRLRRMAPEHRPGLDRSGEHALHVLGMMHSGCSNMEIAQSLASMDSQTFPSPEIALHQVQELALRYAGTK